MADVLAMVTSNMETKEEEESPPMRIRVAERDHLLQMLYECVETMGASADVTEECAQKELGPSAAQALREQQGSLLRAITRAITLLEAATPQPRVKNDDPDAPSLDVESIQQVINATATKTIARAAGSASAAGQRGGRRCAWGPAPLKALPRATLPTASSSVTNAREAAANRVSAARNMALSGAKTLNSRPTSRSSTNVRSIQKATPISSKSTTSFAPRPISRVTSRKDLSGVESRPASCKNSRLRFATGLPSTPKDDKRTATPAAKTSSRTGPLPTPGGLKRCITSF